MSRIFLCSEVSYSYFLFTSLMYLLIAMVILGVSGVGALIFTVSPCSFAALMVVLPKTAIRVLFCLKSGKFSKSDLIPLGLKNTRMS